MFIKNNSKLKARSIPIFVATSLLAPLAATAQAQATNPVPAWDVYADTWVATDDLGRVMPTAAQVGPLRANRQVGIFYFLWVGREDMGSGPFNISEILQKHPDAMEAGKDGVFGQSPGFHWWNEPIFGYYNIQDPAIIRKHAQMLTDAGVDMLLFDTTNNYNYPDAVNAICRVYHQMKAEGLKVPQLAFHAVAASGDQQIAQVATLYDTFYKSGQNDDLWYRWKGKPLILADGNQKFPEGLGEYFTFRKSYWGGKNSGPDGWDTDSFYPSGDPKHIPYSATGEQEELSVSVASSIVHAPISSMGPGTGRTWSKTVKDGHRETGPDAVAKGVQFQDNWDFALQKDPPFIFTYGWNEWVAQRFKNPDGSTFFVDQFNEEFSKDIEPMKGGFGDAYYYQLAQNIRRYKGARSLPPISRANITAQSDWANWKNVVPEFRDTLFDPVKRDAMGWNPSLHYTNLSGRNDLMIAKTALSGDNLAFTVQTREKLTPATTGDWMALYVDADQNPKTGWMGYDYKISPADGTIMRNIGGLYTWDFPQKVDVRKSDNALQILVPLKTLGLTPDAAGVDFKWTDNCYAKGDWSDFTLNGDAAPNDRFNYRAKFRQ